MNLKRYYSIYTHATRNVRFNTPDPATVPVAVTDIKEMSANAKKSVEIGEANTETLKELKTGQDAHDERLKLLETPPAATEEKTPATENKEDKGAPTGPAIQTKDHGIVEELAEAKIVNGRISLSKRQKETFMAYIKAVGSTKDPDQFKRLKDMGCVERKQMDGAFGVPDEFVPVFQALMQEVGVARAAGATVWPTETDTIIVPRLTTRPTAAFVNLDTASGETNPAGEQVTMTTKEASYHTPLAIKTINTAFIDLADIIFMLFVEAFGRLEDHVIFEGDGGGTDVFTGILNETGVNEIDLVSAGPGIDTLVDMEAAVDEGGADGAAYFFNRKMLAYLKRLKTTDGEPLWMRLDGTVPDMINGYPWFVSDQGIANGGAGNKESSLYYGNMRHVYIAEQQTFAIRVSDEAAFLKRQRVFQAVADVAYEVMLPGAFTRTINAKHTT